MRSLFGLRRRPGRIALAFMRLPLHAYEHGAGWIFGSTFMQFTHLGRRTGAPHEAVAMVLRRDAASGEVVICAAWGPRTDWYRNLRAAPAVSVQVGRETFVPEHRFLEQAEAVEVARRFRRLHPHRFALVCRILGWGDLRDDASLPHFVDAHPFVAFRPVRARPGIERRTTSASAG